MSTNVIEKPRPRIEQEKAVRRRRQDVTEGRLRNLAVTGDKDPRYEYRWINDDPGRVYNLTQADDWEVVTAGQMGGERDARDKNVGSNIERIVDKRTGKRAVLVRKLKDYYVSDKAKEQAELDELDAAIKRGKPSNSSEALAGPAAYVPQGAIVINDGRRS